MINSVTLLGNLTSEPDLKYTQSGQAVANVNIATNRTWKDKDGNKQEEATFHRLVIWGPSAEFVSNYMGKGSKAYVEGRISNRSYDKDGVKVYISEIVVQNIQSLSPKSEDSAPPQPGGAYSTGDDVPFSPIF